jgi:hypothetical protein
MRELHQPPYYTDNLMNDLRTERFFKPELASEFDAMRVVDEAVENGVGVSGVAEDRRALACCGFRGQAVKLIRPSFRTQPG